MAIGNGVRRRAFRHLGFLLCASLGLLFPPRPCLAAGNGGIRVYVDGTQVRLEAPPVEVNGRVLVPFRGVLERLGADVAWAGGHVLASLHQGLVTVDLAPGVTQATVTRQPGPAVSSVYVSPPAMLLQGRVYVPLRFLAESLLGPGSVQWDPAMRIVHIASGPGGTPPPAGPVTTSEGGAVPAPSGPKVGVMAFQDQAGDAGDFGAAVPDLLQAGLARRGVACVERQHVTQVLQEMHLQASGLTDPSMAARAGKWLGATHVMYGTLIRVGDLYELVGHLVNVETASILWSSSARGERRELLDLPGRLAQDTANYLQFGTAPQPQPMPREVGYLSVVTQPSGAEVYVDGQVVGQSPLTRAEVSPGQHQLTIKRLGFWDQTQVITVQGGRLELYEYRLSPAPVTVQVNLANLYGILLAAAEEAARGRYEIDRGFDLQHGFKIGSIPPPPVITFGRAEARQSQQSGGLEIALEPGDHPYEISGAGNVWAYIFAPVPQGHMGLWYPKVSVDLRLTGNGSITLNPDRARYELVLAGPVQVSSASPVDSSTAMATMVVVVNVRLQETSY